MGTTEVRARGDDYKTEASTNVTALEWFDNKPVYLDSA